MKETTKIIKNLNMRVRYVFNSNKFMESTDQSARDKFNHYMEECKKCEMSCCESRRAKEILEDTINILENRYDDYKKFHNVEREVF